ncbi:hypothetical protein FOL47_008191 [Perkinsus chesapeaki]|uniref:RRM domain-containing protein n=1 Tax=Perkinsus chesapeaki TaxID=330153 RepID=A0A7J6LFP4_PERCH|nr:hypothetical protein FOL47_008191 [Perkinsus chesapeaki]
MEGQTNTIFVRNLAVQANEQNLRDLFSRLDRVLNVQIMTFPGTTLRYARVDFGTSNGVTAAHSLNGQPFHGVPLTVSVTDPVAGNPSAPARAPLPNLGTVVPQQLSGAVTSIRPQPGVGVTTIGGGVRDSGEELILNRTVYVSGLANQVTLEEVRGMFGHFGEIKESSIDVSPYDQAQFALVEFRNEAAAQEAIRVGEIPYRGRVVRVEKAKETVKLYPPTDVVFGKPMTIGRHVTPLLPGNPGSQISGAMRTRRDEIIEEVGEAALQIEDWLESRGYWHPSEEARRVRDEFRRKHHGHHSRDSDRGSRRGSRSSRGGHHRSRSREDRGRDSRGGYERSSESRRYRDSKPSGYPQPTSNDEAEYWREMRGKGGGGGGGRAAVCHGMQDALMRSEYRTDRGSSRTMYAAAGLGVMGSSYTEVYLRGLLRYSEEPSRLLGMLAFGLLLRGMLSTVSGNAVLAALGLSYRHCCEGHSTICGRDEVVTNAQYGQDTFVAEWFGCDAVTPRRYIDIGAFDGRNLSSTYALERYFNFSTGICIDAHPKDFTGRKCSVIKAVVGSVDGAEVVYRRISTGLLESQENSGSVSWVVGVQDQMDRTKDGLFVDEKSITRSIGSILLEARWLPGPIDFISLDVEGSELAALKGFPFDMYCVRLWLIEEQQQHSSYHEAVSEFMRCRAGEGLVWALELPSTQVAVAELRVFEDAECLMELAINDIIDVRESYAEALYDGRPDTYYSFKTEDRELKTVVGWSIADELPPAVMCLDDPIDPGKYWIHASSGESIVGSERTVSCAQGFTSAAVTNTLTIRCTDKGEWSPWPVPTERLECVPSDPYLLDSGGSDRVDKEGGGGGGGAALGVLGGLLAGILGAASFCYVARRVVNQKRVDRLARRDREMADIGLKALQEETNVTPPPSLPTFTIKVKDKMDTLPLMERGSVGLAAKAQQLLPSRRSSSEDAPMLRGDVSYRGRNSGGKMRTSSAMLGRPSGLEGRPQMAGIPSPPPAPQTIPRRNESKAATFLLLSCTISLLVSAGPSSSSSTTPTEPFAVPSRIRFSKPLAGPSSPSSRYGGAFISMGEDSVYLIGGCTLRSDGSKVLHNDMWELRLGPENQAEWFQVAEACPWAPRMLHAVVQLDDGSLVLSGGETEEGLASDVWIYSTETKQWRLITESAPWKGRAGHVMMVAEDYVYLSGGFVHQRSEGNCDIWRASPFALERWKLISTYSKAKTCPVFPGYAIPPPSIPETVSMFAGRSVRMLDSQVTFHNAEWEVTPSDKSYSGWRMVRSKAPWDPRFAPGMAATEDAVVLVGGQACRANSKGKTCDPEPLGDIWVRMKGMEWIPAPDELPKAVAFPAVVALQNKIIIFGGRGSDGTSDDLYVTCDYGYQVDPTGWDCQLCPNGTSPGRFGACLDDSELQRTPFQITEQDMRRRLTERAGQRTTADKINDFVVLVLLIIFFALGTYMSCRKAQWKREQAALKEEEERKREEEDKAKKAEEEEKEKRRKNKHKHGKKADAIEDKSAEPAAAPSEESLDDDTKAEMMSSDKQEEQLRQRPVKTGDSSAKNRSRSLD